MDRIDSIEKAAIDGDIQAQYQMGAVYEWGIDVEKNDVRAMEWYRCAASAGHAGAIGRFAWYTMLGWGGLKRDERKALALWEEGARLGDVRSLCNMGRFFGCLILPSTPQPLLLLQRAADQGDEQALLIMCKYLPEQYKVDEVVRRCGGLCTSYGQNYLGYMYHTGEVVKKNIEAAVKWYEKAAENKSPTVAGILCSIYRSGVGIDKSEDKALAWIRYSALQGHPEAQAHLGNLFRHGELGLQQDMSESLYWVRKSAEQGCSIGRRLLGYFFTCLMQWDLKLGCVRKMYELGQGLQVDYHAAMAWYKLAAEQGDSRACCAVAKMYCAGRGVVPNFPKCIEWYRRAAIAGNIRAKLKLRHFYRQGHRQALFDMKETSHEEQTAN